MSSSKKHKGCLRRVLDMVLAVVVAVVAVFAMLLIAAICLLAAAILNAHTFRSK